jgi:hypothetical protein
MSEDGIKEIKALMLPGVSKSDVVRVALSEALRRPEVLRQVRRRLAEMSDQR